MSINIDDLIDEKCEMEVNPIFMSDIEERDFLHFVVDGNSIQVGDIVDIEKRMKGE